MLTNALRLFCLAGLLAAAQFAGAGLAEDRSFGAATQRTSFVMGLAPAQLP